MSYLKHMEESVNKIEKKFNANFDLELIVTKGNPIKISTSSTAITYTFKVKDRSFESDLAMALYCLIADSYIYCKSEADHLSIHFYPEYATVVFSEECYG